MTRTAPGEDNDQPNPLHRERRGRRPPRHGGPIQSAPPLRSHFGEPANPPGAPGPFPIRCAASRRPRAASARPSCGASPNGWTGRGPGPRPSLTPLTPTRNPGSRPGPRSRPSPGTSGPCVGTPGPPGSRMPPASGRYGAPGPDSGPPRSRLASTPRPNTSHPGRGDGRQTGRGVLRTFAPDRDGRRSSGHRSLPSFFCTLGTPRGATSPNSAR